MTGEVLKPKSHVRKQGRANPAALLASLTVLLPSATPAMSCAVVLLSIQAAPAAAFSTRTVAEGWSEDLGAWGSGTPVVSPSASEHAPIVGIGASSVGELFFWYADGKVSSGTMTDFEYHFGKVEYALPEGKNPWDIVAMAVRKNNDRVVTYYADGEFSVGSFQDLGLYHPPRAFSLSSGKNVRDIVGICHWGADNSFYTFYSDGTFSIGRQARRLGGQDTDFEIPSNHKIGHLIDVAIDGNTVLSWWHDVELGEGHESIGDQVDSMVMDVMQRYNLPGLGVAVSKDGRVVLEKGYGYRDLTAGERMNHDSPGRIGSVSKVITALAAFYLHENHPFFKVSDFVYGPGGALPDPFYEDMQALGIARHQPIVAKAINRDNQVVTWNDNGFVEVGTVETPDYYEHPVPYTLAPDKAPVDVRAMAIDGGVGFSWVFYDDGTFGAGSHTDLQSVRPRSPDDTVVLPNGYQMTHIVGIAMTSSDVWEALVWYDDGTHSAGIFTGTTWDFTGFPPLGDSYSVAPGMTPYMIRGIGIEKDDDATYPTTYTFLSNDEYLHGLPHNLDVIGADEYDVPLDPAWPEWYGNMKVDRLLSHCAGFERNGDTVGAARMFDEPEDELSYQQIHGYQLATRKLRFEPRNNYSNHGFGVLGLIIAEQSSGTYDGFVRFHIVDPLGLHIRSTHNPQEPNDMSRHSYDENNVPESYIDDPAQPSANGGWKSSAGDLVRLMLATDGKANNGEIFQNPATLSLMETRPHPNVSNYAHGWNKDDDGKLAHDGMLGGGTTYIAKYPDAYVGLADSPYNYPVFSFEVTVAIATNIWISDDRGGSDVLRRLANHIAIVIDKASIGQWYDLY